jgi:hypothetical protein
MPDVANRAPFGSSPRRTHPATLCCAHSAGDTPVRIDAEQVTAILVDALRRRHGDDVDIVFR